MNRTPRIAFAANRQIGVQSLQLLQEQRIAPVALLMPEGRNVDRRVVGELSSQLPQAVVFRGKSFRTSAGIAALRAMELDYILSVHFPYVVPSAVLETARIGALNLHPAYLPYNRGWHTPSWAILDQTPYGATLHWMDDGLDTGDLALQSRVAVHPGDTADTLYARVLAAELELLREAIPLILCNALPRIPQRGLGTEHKKADLEQVRRLNLHERMTVGEVLRKLRGLTTNRKEEAAWFEVDGKRYLVQLEIRRDTDQASPPLQVRRAA